MVMMLFSLKGKGRNNKKAAVVVVAGQHHAETTTTSGIINNNKRHAAKNNNNHSLLRKDLQPSSTRSVASTVSESSSSIASYSLHNNRRGGGGGPLNPITSGPISPSHHQHSSRVRFNPSLKIREALHVRDYTPTEIASCWYDKFESDEIVNEAKFVISLYDDTDLIIDENKYPQRGLEFLYMKHNNNNTNSNKNNGDNNNNNNSNSTTAKLSRQAVFDEQTKLKSGVKKILDPCKIQSRIQSVYTIYTQGSRMQARLLALSDELAVK